MTATRYIRLVACALCVYVTGCSVNKPDYREQYQSVLSKLPLDADRSERMIAVQARLIRRGLYRDREGRLKMLVSETSSSNDMQEAADIPAVRDGDVNAYEKRVIVLPLPE